MRKMHSRFGCIQEHILLTCLMFVNAHTNHFHRETFFSVYYSPLYLEKASQMAVENLTQEKSQVVMYRLFETILSSSNIHMITYTSGIEKFE